MRASSKQPPSNVRDFIPVDVNDLKLQNGLTIMTKGSDPFTHADLFIVKDGQITLIISIPREGFGILPNELDLEEYELEPREYVEGISFCMRLIGYGQIGSCDSICKANAVYAPHVRSHDTDLPEMIPGMS